MRLNKQIKIYVPGTVNATETATEEKVRQAVEDVARQLSGMFGGSTAQDVNGFYLSDVNGLISEKITVVYSFCTSKQFRQNKKRCVEICENLKKEFNQECISLELNNKLYLI